MTTFNTDFSFTRGTGATRVNAQGLIVGVDFSSTSNTVTIGSKTFTLAADLNVNRDWTVGEDVRVIDQVSGNVMIGTVTSYTPSTQSLVLNIASVTGSGTFTNWRIGSLEARRDAVTGALISEEARSNILFPSEPVAANYVSTNSLTLTDNRLNIFDATATDFGTSKGVRFCRIIPATTLDQNGRTGTGAVNFGGVLFSRGTLNGASDFFSVIINPSTWTNDINVCCLGNNNTAGPNANGSSTPLFNNGVYIGPAGGATDLGGGDFLVRLQVPVATAGQANHGLTFFTITPGDGVKGWLIGGYQVEQNTRSATSYIPTTTVAVTRNADSSAFSALSLSKIGSRGAAFFELQSDDIGATQKRALRLTGPTGELRLVKQAVGTTANFTKMAEGGGVRLMGANSLPNGYLMDNGLEYAGLTPIYDISGSIITNFSFSNAIAFDGGANFGLLAGGNSQSEFLIRNNRQNLQLLGTGGNTHTGCHWNGSRFIIATAIPGVVVISTDGLSYRTINTPVIAQPCNEVTSGMVGPILRNVIVGNAGFIATSDDNGETWVSRTSGTAQGINCVTFGNNLFVAGTNNNGGNNIVSSTDGITWTLRNLGTPNIVFDVHFANGIFVAVIANGLIRTSTDGITWTAPVATNTTQTLLGVHYNASANLWVAVGGNGTIITATDPTGTWTLRTSGTTENLNEVNYFNNLFIAVASTNTLLTSPNGITWTIRGAGITGNQIGIAASPTRLIITGTAGGFASSEDGLTYTSRTNNNATLNGIAYGAGVYVSVGNAVNGSGYIATIDGAGTVTRRVSGVNNIIVDVKYLNGAFYASHNTGLGGTLRSVDGASWLDIQNTRAAANRTSVFGNGIYLFLGNFAIYNLSTNGTSVTSNGLTGLASANVNGADFANGVFVIVADGGRISTTTDGVTYTLRTSGTTQNLTSVMYSQRDQRWYAAGNAGTLLYSEDNGVTWYPVTNSAYVGVTDSGLQSSLILPPLRTGVNRMAISWDTNNVKLSCNGVTVSDTVASIPAITAGSIAENLNGQVRKFRQYSYALTDAELNALTGV